MMFNLFGQEYIKELGYPVFDTTLYPRITYQEAIKGNECCRVRSWK